jgi:cytoskeletal protein CcmA (bactofilin family)
MIRVPGTRKPVSTKPPPTPHTSSGGPSFFERIKAKLATGGKSSAESKALADSTASPTNRYGTGQRSVRCFECGHILQVSAAARSTQCGRCTRYISLEDYEITTAWSHNIYTRGDIVIAKHGTLVGTEVCCHDLTVNGELSATVDCSGDAIFRGPARILGSMHCRHLRVEKKAKLTFPQGVIAESADIYGQLDGDLLCSGPVCIYKSGSVLGDVTARGIEVKEGGILTGEKKIGEHIELPPHPKKTHRFDREDG